MLLLVLLVCLISYATRPIHAQPAEPLPGQTRIITEAFDAHSLTSQQAARRYPVHLRGVVTYLEENPNNNHTALFLNDSSGSVYVSLSPPYDVTPLHVGSLIDVHGFTGAGRFAPVVDRALVKAIGTAPLPSNPESPTRAHLMSGTDDGQWVEVVGVVHSVSMDQRYAGLQLAMDDGVLPVTIDRQPGVDYSSLVDARIRVRGNVVPLFDHSRSRLIGARIRSPGMSTVEILQVPTPKPFRLPVVAIADLLQWSEVPSLAHRLHVQGNVTLQWRGVSVCLHDATQSICAKTRQTTPLRLGEFINLAGFARTDGSAATMSDAVYSPVPDVPDTPVAPLPLTAEQALLDGHDSQLVQIDGQLISRDLTSPDTTLILSSGKSIFTVVLPHRLSTPASDAWKIGSILRITGICAVQIDDDRTEFGYGTAEPKSFSILLGSPGDVLVLEPPSWWTPRHAVLLLALALTLALAVIVWVMVLRKRLKLKTTALSMQTELLTASEERFRHMALHDSLTGLATRVLLRDRMDEAIKNATRYGTGVAVFMLDLDRFKHINDLHGHAAGDEVLRATADRILNAVRPRDTVARLGGDEFVVLLPELDSGADAEQIASRIISSVQTPILFGDLQLSISVSIGIYAPASCDLKVDAMIKCADAALYRAKQSGRGHFEIYSPDVPTIDAPLPLPTPPVQALLSDLLSR